MKQTVLKQSDTSVVRPSFLLSRSFRQSSTEIQAPAERTRSYSTGRPLLAPSTFEQPGVGHSFDRIAVNSPAQSMIQTKLTIGQLGDKYEQEADRVADQVMRMPEPKPSMIQRKSTCPECSEEQEMQVQSKSLASQLTPFNQIQGQIDEKKDDQPLQPSSLSSNSPPLNPGLQNWIRSINGGGRPLVEPVRSYFEHRFGYDFNNVRVHTDAAAEAAAMSVNARAFTKGNDMVFGVGEYSPGTSQGKRLLAHELTHVVQQQKRKGTGSYIQRVPPPHSSNFIMAIFVDLTRQTVSWIYDNGMVSATHQCSTGAGLCGSDCSSPGPGSACTPAGGPFPICSRRPHGSYRYFVGIDCPCSRQIGFHYYRKVDGCPWSHGCVRLHEDAIDLIYQGARVRQTLVYVTGTPNLRRCWTSSTAGRCWRRERTSPRQRTNLRCAWHDCWDIGDFPAPPPNIRVV